MAHRQHYAWSASLIALAIAGAGCQTDARPARTAAPSLPLTGVTVILDPGHGGQDTGAISGGLYEATINYRMAATVAALLRSEGAQVSYTVQSATLMPDLKEGKPEPHLARPIDAHLVYNGELVRLRGGESPDDLYRRALVTRSVPDAQRARTYFLSLHCDKLSDPHGHGARVYCDKRDKAGPSRFALALKRRLTKAGLTNSPGGMVIPRGYGVLNPLYNTLPQRALVELATISNAKDRRSVQTAKWRWHMAHVLVAAIAESEGQDISPLAGRVSVADRER